jgi:hypothetical protein
MIKKGNQFKKKVDPTARVQLIRKGNEFFSKGQLEQAEKIFITIDYKDGLVRLGDYYLKNNNLYKCAMMYFMSENQSKINAFCKKAALIIEKMLNEDKIKNDKLNEYNKILIDKKRIIKDK